MLKVQEYDGDKYSDVKLDVPSNNDSKNEDTEKSDKEKEKKDEKPESVGPIELFKFADGLDKFLIIVGILCAIACGCVFSVMYIMFGDITTVLAGYHDPRIPPEQRDEIFMEGIIRFAIEITGVGFGIWVTHYIFVAALNYSAERMVLRIRKEFLKAVLKQDVGWFDTTTTSDFASRMTEDLNKIQDGMGEKVGMLFRFIIAGITAFIYPFVENWLLSLVLLSLVPILAVMGGIMGKIMTSVSKDEMDNYGTAGSIAEEVLASIRTVVAFGGQKKEVEKFSVELQAARKNAFIRGTLTATTMGLMFGIIYAMYGLGLWYGIKIVLDDKESEEFPLCSSNCTTKYTEAEYPDDFADKITQCITETCFRFSPGSIVVCVFGILQGGMGMGQSSPYAEAFNVARSAAVTIFRVIDRKPDIDSSSPEGVRPSKFLGQIKFKNIAFNYPARKEVQVLKDFNLEIEGGKTVALVGPSGCGKSTCIQLLQRFYDPDVGAVMLDGVNLKELNVGWLRDHIGVVGQEPVLFDCSIKDNIRYAKADASEEEIMKACKEANAYDFIQKLPQKLDTMVGEGGAQLSGGQKQRIAIARALIRNPQMLLLDEATSALDNESEALVQAALDRLSGGSRTTVIVAHRLSTIRNADMIVAFEKGKVAEQGTHEDLMEQEGIYHGLVERQMAGKEDLNEEKENFEDLEKSGEMDRGQFDRQSKKQLSRKMTRQISVKTTSEEKKKKEVLKTSRTTLWIRLLKLNTPELPFVLVGILGALLFGAASPLFAVVFGDMLSVLSEPDTVKARTDSEITALKLAGVGLAFFVAVSLQGIVFSWSGAKLVERLRRMLFETMLKQEIGWFDEQENNTGALCARMSSSAEAVSSGTGAKVGQAVGGIATLVFSTVTAVYYDWRLGIVSSMFLPPLILSMLYQMRMLTGQGAVQKEALEEAAKVAVEAINNVRTVAGLRCEEKILGDYAASLEKPSKSSKKQAHIRGMIYGFANAYIFFAYGLCFYYGGWLLINVNGSIEAPMDIWRVAIAVLSGGMFVGMSFSSFMDIQNMFLAADKIFEVLDREPRIEAGSETGVRLGAITGNTKVEGGNFTYPTRKDAQVLNDLSFSIQSGQKVALVGQSGCGKSTVIQLIQRFYDLDQGTLSLEDTDIKQLSVPFVRSNLGIVSQEPVLFNRSIADNIRYGDNEKELSMEQIIDAAKKANIHNFVSSLPEGYETNVGGKGTQLSGGQKQRVAIARAMVRDPAILLLDEATSALDSESEKIVQEALETAQVGRTSITIAHRLSTIMDSDVIFVLEKGVVAEAGTHMELLGRKGVYYKLWNRSTT